MITGIYRLTFNNGDTYVGQARDIQARYAQHCDKLLKDDAAQKMQKAFNGKLPDIEILIQCHQDYLNVMEMYYINVKKPTLNTVIPAFRPNEEVDTLMSNVELLMYPPATIIQALAEANESIQEHEDKYEELHDELTSIKEDLDNKLLHLRVEAELKDGKDENKELVEELLVECTNLQAKVSRIYSRNLWQRIFNHLV